MSRPVAPHVGVVLLDYNQRATTARCVQGLAQGSMLPGHVVIVENGSTPVTPVPYADAVHLDVMRPGRNLGPGSGRNAGIQQLVEATHIETIVMLDNDTTVSDDFVARAARYRADSPVVVAPLILDADGHPWSCGGAIDADGTTKMFDGTDGPLPQDRSRVAWAPGACTIIPRAAWAAVGGYDPAYAFFFEDTEWCLRAGRLGWPIVVDRTVVVVHHPHGSLGGVWSPARSRHWGRSGAYFRIVALKQPARAVMTWIAEQVREIIVALANGEVANAAARTRGVAEGLALAAWRQANSQLRPK